MDVGSWVAAAIGLTVWLVAVTAAVCTLLGMLLAAAARLPLGAGGLAGGLGGPLALLVLAVVALARVAGGGRGAVPPVVAGAVGTGPVGSGSVGTGPVVAGPVLPGRLGRGLVGRGPEAVLLAVAVAALTTALSLDAFSLSAPGLPLFALPVFGTGLETLILFSLFALAGTAVLVWWGRSRWAAALAAVVAGSWLALLGAVIALWLPLRAALAAATTVGGTVGDAAAALGFSVDRAELVVPAGGLFDVLGLAGRRFALAGVDLATVIPHLSLGLGLGILSLIAAALACAVLAVIAARRGARRTGV